MAEITDIDIDQAVDTVLNIPTDYIVGVVLIAIVVGLIVALYRGYPAYREQYKAEARSSGTAIAYGIGYLETDIASVVAGAVATVLIVGWTISQGIIDASSGSDVYIYTGIIAFVASYFADRILSAFHEAARDKAKGDEALKAEAPADPAKPSETADSEDVVVVKQ